MALDLASQWIPGLSSAPSITERKECIFIAHECDRARERLRQLVEDEGYATRLIDSPEGIVSALSSENPDLILMNIASETSLELCGELRMIDATRDVPIVLVSEDVAVQELVAHGLLAGADDYVSVGARPAEFRARVRVQLRNKRYRDALKRVRSEREVLRRQAAVDPLTGLLNRRSLGDVFSEKVIAGDSFAILFMDIDRFKSINDRFGHAAGDAVLRAVAESLRRGMRSGDFCGRYGGEEFVVGAPDVTPEQATRLGERIRAAIAQLRPAELGGLPVTVSIGVAVFNPETGETSDDVLERADAALYTAKMSGRDQVVLAAPCQPSNRPQREGPPTKGHVSYPRSA